MPPMPPIPNIPTGVKLPNIPVPVPNSSGPSLGFGSQAFAKAAAPGPQANAELMDYFIKLGINPSTAAQLCSRIIKASPPPEPISNGIQVNPDDTGINLLVNKYGLTPGDADNLRTLMYESRRQGLESDSRAYLEKLQRVKDANPDKFEEMMHGPPRGPAFGTIPAYSPASPTFQADDYIGPNQLTKPVPIHFKYPHPPPKADSD